jgi:hypothetical protein
MKATELPKIYWKGKQYIFDYSLSQLRSVKPIKFISLDSGELELLDYAVRSNDRKLINQNMNDLEYKLKEVMQ